MSSLKDLASLIMIPSLVKDGRLDTVKPLGNGIIHPDATGNNDGTDGSTPSEGNFTFSRGSNLAATRVDVNGLIEKGRENLLLQSNQFDTTWATPNSNITSGQSGYDGSNDAWLVSATANFGRVEQVNSTTGVSTLSVYAKAGTADWIALRLTGSGFNDQQYFNLANGSVGINRGCIAADIEDVGDGWYRCTATTDGPTMAYVILYVALADGNLSTTNETIYIQDAQLEQSLVATDYIETGASTAQAGILEDLPRLDYSGGASCPALLLEPQRSNLITYSEFFDPWNTDSGEVKTANTILSPEGLVNGNTLRQNNGASQLNVYKVNSVTSGADYVFSVWLKKKTTNEIQIYQYSINAPVGFVSRATIDFDAGTITNVLGSGATIEPYANGWFRCSIKCTMPSNSLSSGIYTATAGQADVYVYGAQLEQGSYPTSYIPTYGSAVTRSSENHQLNITSIIESSSFSWFFDLGDWVGSATNGGTYELINTGSTRIQLRVRSDGYRMYYQNINGGSAYPVSGSQTANKFCVAYDGLNYRLFIDGVLRNTYPSVGDTNWSFLMNVGGNGVNERLIIKQEVLFPTALTDSECIALTTI